MGTVSVSGRSIVGTLTAYVATRGKTVTIETDFAEMQRASELISEIARLLVQEKAREPFLPAT